MRRVAIIADYIPHYRASFYELLRTELAERDVQLTVIYDDAPLFEHSAGSTFMPDWGTRIHVRWIKVKGRYVQWHSRSLRLVRGYDLVITHQASRVLVNYALVAWSRLGGPPFALWGHGRSFQAGSSKLAERVKQWVTNQARWFFAYTDKSAGVVASTGYPAARITSVRNTVDTQALREHLASITDEEVAALREELGVRSEHVAVFVGRFWAHRAPDYLLEAVEAARRHLPDFEVVVVGEGELDAPVRAMAAEHDWFHWVGAQYGRDVVLHQRLGSVLLMPAPVGLIAIDSFVMGKPLVTLELDNHNPEYDYLSEETSLILPKGTTPEEYGKALADLLLDEERLARLSAGSLEAATAGYTIDNMVARYVGGILAAIGEPAGPAEPAVS